MTPTRTAINAFRMTSHRRILAALLVFLVQSPLAGSSVCPITNGPIPCACSTSTDHTQTSQTDVVCETLGQLLNVPTFATPATVIASVEIDVGLSTAPTSILTVQNSSFSVITPAIIRLSSLQIQTVQADAFHGLQTIVKQIYLNNNGIYSLYANTFNTLKNLAILDLGSNQLTSLPATVFSNLANLQTLDLSYNHLKSLPTGIFSSLTGLTSLDLSYNSLTTLSYNFLSASTKLLSLNLCNNQFGVAFTTATFSSLPSLVNLSLAQNAFTQLPMNLLGSFLSLQNLNLTNNQLTSVESLTTLTHLTTVALDVNQITAFTANTFSKATSLTSLSFSGNKLTQLGALFFANNIYLQTLIASYNAITTIAVNVFGNSNAHLQTLDLSQNELSSFDPSFLYSRLPNLVELDLSYNFLTAMSTSGSSTANKLQTLNLVFNRLTSLPHSFLLTLPNLEVLQVDYNNIALLDTGIFDNNPLLQIATFSYNALTSVNRLGGIALTTLSLSNNAITSVSAFDSAAAQASPSLAIHTLQLGNNQLGQTLSSDTFSGISFTLSYLDLSGNSITALAPGVFKALAALSYLSLANNYLGSITTSQTLDGLSYLQVLDLSGNQMRDLPLVALSSLPSTVKEGTTMEIPTTLLYLAGNNFDCTCDMLWARLDQNIGDATTTICCTSRTAWTWVLLVCNPIQSYQTCPQGLTIPPFYTSQSPFCTNPVVAPSTTPTTTTPTTTTHKTTTTTLKSTITTSTPSTIFLPSSSSSAFSSLSSSSSHGSSSTINATTTVQSSSSRTQNQSTADPPAPTPKSSSEGIIIGAVVGSILAIIVIVVIIVVVLLFRAKRRKEKNDLLNTSSNIHGSSVGAKGSQNYTGPDFGAGDGSARFGKLGPGLDGLHWRSPYRGNQSGTEDVQEEDEFGNRNPGYTDPNFSSTGVQSSFGNNLGSANNNLHWRSPYRGGRSGTEDVQEENEFGNRNPGYTDPRFSSTGVQSSFSNNLGSAMDNLHWRSLNHKDESSTDDQSAKDGKSTIKDANRVSVLNSGARPLEFKRMSRPDMPDVFDNLQLPGHNAGLQDGNLLWRTHGNVTSLPTKNAAKQGKTTAVVHTIDEERGNESTDI